MLIFILLQLTLQANVISCVQKMGTMVVSMMATTTQPPRR